MTPTRVLLLNTISFSVCFAVWILFSVVILPISEDLGLSPTQRGLLLSTPILLGSLLRLPVGVLANRYGARKVFTGLMLLAALPTFVAGFVSSYAAYLATGLALGLVGASFAVGVFAVSSWFPPAQRGSALGVFGSGNIGTAITSLGAPYLVLAVGVATTFKVYAAVLAVTALIYGMLMEDRPEALAPEASLAASLRPLAEMRTWRFGLYYLVTFGGFVALSLKLPSAYRDIYHVEVLTAGWLTTTFTFLASLIRAPGGFLTDRIGAPWTLGISLAVIAVGTLVLGLVPLPLAGFAALALLVGVAQGVGSAAVFKVVPEFFSWDVGTVGGMVGLIGGLGGFILPIMGGVAETLMVTPTSGFLPLAAIAFVTLAIQVKVVTGIARTDRDLLTLQAKGEASRDWPAPGLTAEIRDGVAWARVSGPLDDEDPDAMLVALRPLLRDGATKVTLDFSECSRVSFDGVRALAILLRELKNRKGTLEVYQAPEHVVRALAGSAALTSYWIEGVDKE